MKKNSSKFQVLCLTLITFIMSSCASTPPPVIEGWAKHYEFLNKVTTTQEKENVIITLTPINELEINDHPELFQFNIDSWGEGWAAAIKPSQFWFPPDPSGNQYGNTFVYMPAFFVSVENNTGHILRMSDARLYLVIEGEDPISAIDTFGKSAWVTTELTIYNDKEQIAITESGQEGDESLLDHITRYEYNLVQWLKKVWKSDPKYKNYPWYPFNLLSLTATKNSSFYKLINEVGREILPGFSLNGIVCFPTRLDREQQAKVMFYDVTTETDEAGNPTKKTQFEFEFTYNPKYVRYNELTRQWEETNPPVLSTKK